MGYKRNPQITFFLFTAEFISAHVLWSALAHWSYKTFYLQNPQLAKGDYNKLVQNGKNNIDKS